MTPQRPSRTLRERLRAMTGRPRRALSARRCNLCPHNEIEHVTEKHKRLCECPLYVPAHSRVSMGSFEHTHRVVTPEPPPRRWFIGQGIEKWKG